LGLRLSSTGSFRGPTQTSQMRIGVGDRVGGGHGQFLSRWRQESIMFVPPLPNGVPMKKRAFNFAPGPATLPFEVLEASAAALLDFQGKGFGIAECSHRGKEFDAVLDETIARCRGLLQIPDTHDVLFLQGGATQQFALIPMNFLNGVAEYVIIHRVRPPSNRLDRRPQRRLPPHLLE